MGLTDFTLHPRSYIYMYNEILTSAVTRRMLIDLDCYRYTKINREDESGSHHLELGWVKVTNLLPNTLYKVRIHNQQMRHVS